jgi:3-deoxy-7-phosphoheptulonate synthase
VHDDPEAALCDGPHQIYAKDFPAFAAEVAVHAELLGKRLA